MLRQNPYLATLSSKEFKRRKTARVKATRSHCERCGLYFPRSGLQLHHKTYERLGNELETDLELLCRECHIVADRERQCAHPRFASRLHSWATRYLGKEYADMYPPEVVQDRYFRSKEAGR